MTTASHVVALDQGTTSSRAVVYDASGKTVASFSVPLKVSFPKDGWVEQDAVQVYQTQLEALKGATKTIDPKSIRAFGITNQRETIVCWDRKSGTPVAPAIVWQCRRSTEICNRLKKDGLENEVRAKTGLVLDPYFSASKILWLQENVAGLRERMKRGEVLFGTIDTWVLYNLTEGKTHATEPTNASRTMLYSLEGGKWDSGLLKAFGVHENNLPEIKPSHSHFGTSRALGTDIPICAILGDQQSSLFGHGGFAPNAVKCTFGTGAFLLVNTGTERVHSGAGLILTALWSPDINKQKGSSGPALGTLYALEGSIFMAGALIQWLRDKVGLISSSAESETLASSVADSAGVVVVPAFTGLGAPYWDSEARGAILGLTRDANRAHIVRAALDAVVHQVADVLSVPELAAVPAMSIDGGMSANKFFCQRLADLTGKEICVSQNQELTAFGVASMAALSSGLVSEWKNLETGFRSGLGKLEVLRPSIPEAERAHQRGVWAAAVKRVLSTHAL